MTSAEEQNICHCRWWQPLECRGAAVAMAFCYWAWGRGGCRFDCQPAAATTFWWEAHSVFRRSIHLQPRTMASLITRVLLWNIRPYQSVSASNNLTNRTLWKIRLHLHRTAVTKISRGALFLGTVYASSCPTDSTYLYSCRPSLSLCTGEGIQRCSFNRMPGISEWPTVPKMLAASVRNEAVKWNVGLVEVSGVWCARDIGFPKYENAASPSHPRMYTAWKGTEDLRV